MKTHDSLGRRNKVLFEVTKDGYRAVRVPPKEPPRFTKRMLDILSAIHRSGGYGHPNHIHTLVADGTNETWTRECFKFLFDYYAYLEKVINHPKCSTDKIFNVLTDKGKRILEAEGLLHDNVPHPKGHPLHQIFVSVLLQSFEGNAKYRPTHFTPQHEFWTGEHMQVEGRDIKPDAVFKLEVNGKDVLCFLEADRATESYATIKDKAKAYRTIIKDKIYQKPYNHTGGALVLFVTTNESRVTGILDKAIKPAINSPCSYILTTHVDGFGTFYDPPEKIELLRRKWKRYGKEDAQFLSG